MAARLTDISIKNAKPGPTRREIPDGGCKGLYLVIQPSGKKSWAVRYRYEGKPRKLTLDGFPPLATARKLASAAIENPDHDPAAEKQARKATEKQEADAKRDLFPEIVTTYLKHYAEGRATRKNAKPKPRTYAETKRLLDQLATPEMWGEKRIQDIGKRDVIELLDGIVDRGAPYVANRTYAAISPLFAWAAQRDIIEASPVIWNKVAETARDRHLTAHEIKLFWKATETLGHPFQTIFRLLLLTGQRKSEVNEIVESELDFEKRVWTIGADRTKNRREHVVPLADPVLAILKDAPRIKNDRDLIFTTNGETPPSGFTKPVEACRAKMNELAGKTLPRWSLHDLRRTVSTMMNEELAIDPHIVEAVLNHVSGSRAGVAGTYNRASYFKQKKEALQLWSNHISRLTT
ncbi:tyrosine-type recombinase/integrase [Nitratireductor aquimarinus]|uniref:tyrosine-type recombinase/integrase n=1 Tax=Nitratireductor TaxID=245876 RepID=UPI0019D37F94|nr:MULTISPECIES: site-specific integrase [Nitratireductor]MBN7776720.1 tyrosine-type recombinase/integrase [Nitratireductor pacificus]MBN7780054.1 tyrosine-type recombinase/integrase [Nitratireductor pacificus]MBN7788861.1 tyrosine-type recombinase/integrase [Nitratireductor aquimarinus]MBY6098929.1 tyrosine-type recombinase/integrase [Nitratireductor aquimarinus]MCA1259411.1 tyrosine-type recombinase/integrase [Nitratireductor aquimarinus]